MCDSTAKKEAEIRADERQRVVSGKYGFRVVWGVHGKGLMMSDEYATFEEAIAAAEKLTDATHLAISAKKLMPVHVFANLDEKKQWVWDE